MAKPLAPLNAYGRAQLLGSKWHQGTEDIGIEIRQSDPLLDNIGHGLDSAAGSLAHINRLLSSKGYMFDWRSLTFFIMAIFGACWILIGR